MADLNTEIAELNSNFEDLLVSKERIRLAIESKLNTHIPETTRLKVFDDYIYKIRAGQENVKYLLTIDGNDVLFDTHETEISGIIFDANLNRVDPEVLDSMPEDIDPEGNYSVSKYIKIDPPADLLPTNIAQGHTIFGVEGVGPWEGSTLVTNATSSEVLATDDSGTEITFLAPTGAVTSGGITNNVGVNMPPNALSFEPYLTSTDYVSALYLYPKDRYLVGNTTKYTLVLPNVINAINDEEAYPDIPRSSKLLPENIKVGCNIFGVVGTYTTEESKPIRDKDIRAGRIGYVNGEKITGTLTEREARDLIIDYDTPEGTSTITVPVGVYGSLNVKYLRDAEATLIVNGPIITSSNPNNIYAAGGKTLTYNIVSDCTESGVIRQGALNTSTLTITPRDVIPQEPFNTGVAAENSGVLQDRLYADRDGNVKIGTMPIITETTWDSAVFTDNKLQISPYNSSVSSPNAGYYGDSSKVYISQDVIKDAYNRSVLGTKQIKASNIRTGCTIFGVPGTYGGSYTIFTKVINPIDLDFNEQNSIIFEPNYPRTQAWNKVTVKKDSNLTPDKIKFDTTIYGITGTFTSEPSTGQSLASSSSILNGYSAWVNGDEVKGEIPVNTIGDGNIYTKGQSFGLNGYYSAGTRIRIAKEEQDKIIPGNIRVGETILGVTGTYKGGVLLETIKDSSLNETNASSPVKLDSNGTSFIYNPDGKNAKNRICWYTKNYNNPLAIADSNKYFIPEGAEVSFNVIPNIMEGNTVLPLLVNIFSVEDDYITDPMNPQEITNNITWDYLNAKGRFSYNLLVSKPSPENPDIKIYTTRNVSEGVSGYTVEGAVVYPIDESVITAVWNSGDFEYIKQFNNPGRVEFKYDEVSTGVIYKRYNIFVKSKDGVYADVSDTTAISSDVLKGKYFYSSNGLRIQGSLIKTYDIVTNLEKISGVKSSVSYLGNSYDVGSFIYSKTDSDTGIWVNIEKENSGPPFNWKIIYNNSVLDSGTFEQYPDSDNWVVIQKNVILDNGYNITSYVEYDENINPIYYVVKFEKIDYIDTTATPERVLSPYKFYDINGTLQTGTFSLTTETIRANGENITPSSPYGGFSSVTVNVPQTNLVTYKILSNITGGRSIGGNTTAGIYVSPNDSGIDIYYPGASAMSPWYLYINNSSTGQEIDSEFYTYNHTGGDFTIEFDSEGDNVYIQESIYSDSDLDPDLPVIPYILDIV